MDEKSVTVRTSRERHIRIRILQPRGVPWSRGRAGSPCAKRVTGAGRAGPCSGRHERLVYGNIDERRKSESQSRPPVEVDFAEDAVVGVDVGDFDFLDF